MVIITIIGIIIISITPTSPVLIYTVGQKMAPFYFFAIILSNCIVFLIIFGILILK